MNALQLRERLTRGLLGEIEQVQHPSVTMLNRLEASLTTREALADYTETLVKKVEATRFPSVSMLNRIDGLIARLEDIERQNEQQSR
jgi:hypothetical protein